MAQARTTRSAPRTRLDIFDRTADKLAQSTDPDDALTKLAKQWLALDDGQKKRFLATLSRTGAKRSTSRSSRSSRSSRRSTGRSPAPRDVTSKPGEAKEERKKDKKKKKKDKEKKKDRKAAKKDKKEKKRKKNKEKKRMKDRKGKGGASAGEPMSPDAATRAEGIPSPSTESSPLIPPDTAH